jgi:starch-binding outer membrane protein, SusD/RagB family
MKTGTNIILYIFSIISLFFLSSCESWLELIPPDGLVQDEYWKNKEDVDATLMGAYQTFASLDEKLFMYGELRGDMIDEDVNTPNSSRNIMRGNIIPDNSLCDWSSLYQVIGYCNIVLKNAPDAFENDPTFTEFQLKVYESEAIYLRSLAYFYLIRIFKEVPLVLEASESDNADFYLPKSSEEIIIQQILADLSNYFPFVRDNHATIEENIGRATKGAYLALLADISLWNFSYNDCIDYINQLEAYNYTLLPTGKWFENFYPGNSLEGIFEFQFDNKLEQTNQLFRDTYSSNIYLASEKAQEILSLEDAQEKIRGLGSLVERNSKIWKYAGSIPDGRTLRPSSEQASCNWIVYRYADVLLMKAEALSQTGQFDDALNIINKQIRFRASMPALNILNTAEAFEDVIMEERAIEFAFEGKRWFDLIRMGRRNNYSRKNDLIQIIIENVPSTQRLVLAAKLTDPLGWYLPIYEQEMERNSSLEQNPFYAKYSNND